jgi:hypothetical protein
MMGISAPNSQRAKHPFLVSVQGYHKGCSAENVEFAGIAA